MTRFNILTKNHLQNFVLLTQTILHEQVHGQNNMVLTSQRCFCSTNLQNFSPWESHGRPRTITSHISDVPTEACYVFLYFLFQNLTE